MIIFSIIQIDEEMRKLSWLILILTMVACSPVGTVTAIETKTEKPMSTNTPSFQENDVIHGGWLREPTLTPTNTPTAQNILKERCAEILPAFPEDSIPPGTLVILSPDDLSLVDFRQQTQRTIHGIFDGVGASPNGKWLSYIVIDPTGENDDLVIESADGQKQAQFPFESSAIILDWIPWLDNERIWFPVWIGEEDPTTVVLNPFTGERQELLPGYPDFAPFDHPVNSIKLPFVYNNVAYDPSLRFVVYPQLFDHQYYVVLWDRETKQELVKIPDTGSYRHLPLWLPSNKAFVVVARPDRDGPKEWLMVSRDGGIRQLTHLGDLYSEFEFGLYTSLSPDGHYLAFGLSHEHDPDPYSSKELIILNLQTLETVNTCIKFDHPVWSPDSRYLAVQYWDDTQKQSFMAVVDPDQGWAVKVFTDYSDKYKNLMAFPVAWLDSGK